MAQGSLKSLTQQPGYAAGSYVLFGATAIILAALAFEHVGGYAPCPLCIMQRYAYYVGIPLAFIGLVVMSAGQRSAAGIIFLFVGLAFVANAALGIYHAGAEWAFWPGPSVCEQAAQPLTLGPDFEKAISTTAVPSCTEPAFRAFGLSFAGWNVLISAALAGLAFYATSNLLEQTFED
ncbi:MAG: disulfide bond formation protein B [Pseudomonadota bacterium]